MNAAKLSESLDRMSALLERHDVKIEAHEDDLCEYHKRLVALEIVGHIERGKGDAFKGVWKLSLEILIVVITALVTIWVTKLMG